VILRRETEHYAVLGPFLMWYSLLFHG
jgi:hypothetical protein